MKMHCITMATPGTADVLQLADCIQPSITQSREILVRLKAAGVNPVDTKLRARGTYYPDRSPTILGCDGAGIVESVGTDVTRFKAGDEVYYCYGGIGGTQVITLNMPSFQNTSPHLNQNHSVSSTQPPHP